MDNDSSEPPNWISLLGQACVLLVELFLEDGVSAVRRWETNSNYLFYQETEYLRFELHTADSKVLAAYEFIPRTFFSLKESMTRQLVTVTEEAVIYRVFGAVQLNDEEQEITEKFDQELKKMIEYGKMQRQQDIPLRWPEDLQLIDCAVYPLYIEAQIAIPGSGAVPPGQWENLTSDRMLLLYEVPDMGPVKSRWIPLVCQKKLTGMEEEAVLEIFSSSLTRTLAYPGLSQDILFDAADKIAQLIADPDTAGHYYEKLKHWLVKSKTEPVIHFPAEEELFGDYQPKTTPDTLLDFRPDLADTVRSIPDAQPLNLPALFELYRRYRAQADDNPGQWIDGNPVLGGPDREYQPSAEELLLAEIGDRISMVIREYDKNLITEFTGTAPGSIVYQHYRFIHMDVMGSGRFWYVDHIEDIDLEVPR